MGYKLIIGLGNPGSEYENTRHNAGFRVVDELANRLRATYWKSQCGAAVSKVSYKGEEIILAKPMAFMNDSGGPVKKLMSEYKAGIDEIIVIHDELELPAGEVKSKLGGGHGGHNGLRSIVSKTGKNEFMRVRMGIGRPPGKMPVAKYVLNELRGSDVDAFTFEVLEGADLVLSLL